MNSYTLISIVRKGEASLLMKTARAAGAPGGSIVQAKGTASNSILAALGIGDSRKEVLISVIGKEIKDSILSAVKGVKVSGVALLLDCFRDFDEEDEMFDAKYEMIEVICQDGYSEDIMAVARKAGAKGGTVISGRGTSTDEDVKFFGTPLVPEKEILMIVIEKEKSEKVKKAISQMEILNKKGMGIMFSIPVRDFVNLGY